MKTTSATTLQALTTAGATALALGASSLAMATEYGTVVSSTPAYVQVAVPQQQCHEQPVLVQPATSGAGGLVGALVGGGLGNAVGNGGGRALATGVGLIAGALIGDRTEARDNPPYPVSQTQCQTVSRYENQLMGYDVVYRYNGQSYSARLANDPGAPGAALPLNVNVQVAGAEPAVPMPPMPPATQPMTLYARPPVIYSPAPVVYGPPAVYYHAPYYGPSFSPAFGLSIGGVWGGGHHGHWR
ncbi:glycine zipper 2TM domain-containing protein [Hydrogenophaga palleronii]|uniref:glycine zipper 2TM domain-containing protein n=1 Tax=Hydrogenophaga palleronii TaxID=65655 RepID=UPI0009FBD6C3|nr:hypothetical protein [Hydrogenophaga palleronii]